MANEEIAFAPRPGDVPLGGSERKPRPGFTATGTIDQDDPVRVVVKVRPKSTRSPHSPRSAG
jgi:hypothetical protein